MSTLTVATVKSNSSSPPVFQNTSGTEVGTLCRAWVNFNGSGTPAIRASFNVSSITDISTGRFGVNFATAMSDANFAAVACQSTQNTYIITALNYATTSVELNVRSTSAVYFDSPEISAAIFR